MAHIVMLKNPQTGIIKKGFYGFSWTTLFFGLFPAIFRGDIKTAFILFFLSWVPFIFFIWAFIYNKNYTLKLIGRGYKFCDTPENNRMARAVLGVAEDADACPVPQPHN